MSTTADTDVTGTLVERMGLKTLVESCLVLEEGVASAKDIELGMMMGAGILPGPFSRADEAGLDEMLAALERAQAEWGDTSSRPLILRRLVAPGPAGQEDGTGLLPLPAARRRATSATPCCWRREATSGSRGSTGRRPTRSRPRP